MADAKQYPIKRIQIEAACKLAAELSKEYGIVINTNNILTHAEFGERNPATTSKGKIDIINLPCVAVYGLGNVGNWIRQHTLWYRSRL